MKYLEQMILSGNSKHITLGVIAIFIYLFPYFYLGENAYITTHDFLDSTWGHLSNIINNNAFFKFDFKLPLLYGVDRNSIVYTSMFDIKSIIFYFFSPYWAIVVNLVLVKLIAFVGMYMLLATYLLENKQICLVISFIYSLIPFYVDFGVSSSGVPLLAYAIINIYNKKWLKTSYALVVLYALYSAIGLSGVFVCFLLFVTICALYYSKGIFNKHLVISLILLVFIYILANWAVLYGFFFKESFVSHRTEWVNEVSLKDILIHCIDFFVNSQYHAGKFWALPLYAITTIIYFLLGRSDKKYTLCMVIFAIVSLLTIIGELVRFLPLTIFMSFQFDRFYFLLPSICFVLFAIACEKIFENGKHLFYYLFIITSLICVLRNNVEYNNNIKNIVTDSYSTSYPSYKQFYDTKLFEDISDQLNIPQDYTVKSVSLGLHPSVLEYNGYWCLDGYLMSYSLDYKKEFRKVIAKELSKNETLKKYFDNRGGSRCYMYSSELGKKFVIKKDENKVDNLEIDVNALRNLGCQFLFSAVDIRNYEKLSLEFCGSYTSAHSFYKIYVYKL